MSNGYTIDGGPTNSHGLSENRVAENDRVHEAHGRGLAIGRRESDVSLYEVRQRLALVEAQRKVFLDLLIESRTFIGGDWRTRRDIAIDDLSAVGGE